MRININFCNQQGVLSVLLKCGDQKRHYTRLWEGLCMGAIAKCLAGLIIMLTVVAAWSDSQTPDPQDDSIPALEAKIATEQEPIAKGDLLLRLGDVCEHQQNLTQAEEAFERAVEVTKNLPTRDMALQRLCRFYETHQQLDEKISAWTVDAGKIPPDLDALRALVVALFNVRRDFEHAIPWLEKYAQMDVSDVYRSELLAQAYKHHGDHEKAAQKFKYKSNETPHLHR